MPRLAVLTESGDFHAHVVRHALIERGYDCNVIEIDRLSGNGAVTWNIDRSEPGTIADAAGALVVPADLDAVWCRRWYVPAVIPDHVQDGAARDVIERNVRVALEGLFLTEFTGRWVSDPQRTRFAELKLVQLRQARAVGLRLPRTIVSQDVNRVRSFCEQLDYQVVVKALAGSRIAPTMTGRVTPELLTHDSVGLCPAIYQELVPGTRHLRVCCFGSNTYTATLFSERLDWRYPHDVDAEPSRLDETTDAKLQHLLTRLGLRMGIFDLKLAENGEPFWLELNPQGQFLFLEGLCGMPLIEFFVDFLLAEALGIRRSIGSPSSATSIRRQPAPAGE